MPRQLPRTPAWRLNGSSGGEGRPPVLWDHVPGTAQDPPPKGPSGLVSAGGCEVKGQGEAETTIPEQYHHLRILSDDPLEDGEGLIPLLTPKGPAQC